MTSNRWFLAIGAALISSFPSLTIAMEPPGTQPPPVQSSKSDAVWLRQVTWTEDEREQYYHLTSGTQLIPYSWFLALEQPDTQESFRADDHMKQLHLIPDNAHRLYNPDRLPVGFTKTMFPHDPRGVKEYLGITCAFCHTGELHVSHKDRGLVTIHLFMCFQSSLAKGFQFVQDQWCNYDRGLNDPIAGQLQNVKQMWPSKWDKPQSVNFKFGNHVSLRGGEYFFAPSRSFLREIASTKNNRMKGKVT